MVRILKTTLCPNTPKLHSVALKYFIIKQPPSIIPILLKYGGSLCFKWRLSKFL